MALFVYLSTRLEEVLLGQEHLARQIPIVETQNQNQVFPETVPPSGKGVHVPKPVLHNVGNSGSFGS